MLHRHAEITSVSLLMVQPLLMPILHLIELRTRGQHKPLFCRDAAEVAGTELNLAPDFCRSLHGV